VREKKLVVNPVEAPVVQEIFELYTEHRSAMTVVQILKERGRTTKRHRARNGNARGGDEFNKNAVLRILRNPVYAGYMPYGDELHDGEHEAIISHELFTQARAILETRQNCRPGAGRNPAYILRGVLYCVCGGACTPASTRARGREYRYYRCVTRDKKGNEACNARPLPADSIESFVADRLGQLAATPGLAEEVERELLAKVESLRKTLNRQRRVLPPRIKELKVQWRRLAEQCGETEGSARSLLEDRVADIGRDLDQAQKQLAETERQLAALQQAEVDGRWVTSMLGDFDQVWDVMSLVNRGRLVRALVKKVVVDDAAGSVTVELVNLAAELPASSSGAQLEDRKTINRQGATA